MAGKRTGVRDANKPASARRTAVRDANKPKAAKPKAAKPSHWGICPECQKERKLGKNRLMTYHRRYDGEKMIPCAGSGMYPEGMYSDGIVMYLEGEQE